MADGGAEELGDILFDGSGLEALESLDPAFTTETNRPGSFRSRHVSETVSYCVFYYIMFMY